MSSEQRAHASRAHGRRYEVTIFMTSIRLAELHAFIVHFSIALLFVSVALDIAAVIFRRTSLIEGATWALLIGAPATVAATVSGWLSEHYSNVGVAPQFLHLHKISAALATAVFAILFLVRLLWISSRLLGWLQLAFPKARQLASAQVWLNKALPQAYGKRLPRRAVVAYLILSIIGVALLAITGYLGEAMVYRFGMGVYNPGAPLP
jgi:uncharacterized membrane protein